MKHRWLGFKIFLILTGVYGLIMLYAWLQQEKLLFKPDPFSKLGQSLRALRGGRKHQRKVKEWSYQTPDERTIQGFMSFPSHQTASLDQSPMDCVIYLGGIREECSWVLDHAHHFPDHIFICLNYRGYGLSQGNPGEKEILNDTEQALMQLEADGFIALDRSFLIGRSLGSGVAGYLTHKIHPKKVCLVTPYDSVMSVAKKKYWFLPVHWLFRHPFDAIEWASKNESPMLMLLSEKDETVPHEHSRRLFNAWRGPKEEATIPATDHSTIVLDDQFFPLIAEFFNKE